MPCTTIRRYGSCCQFSWKCRQARRSLLNPFRAFSQKQDDAVSPIDEFGPCSERRVGLDQRRLDSIDSSETFFEYRQARPVFVRPKGMAVRRLSQQQNPLRLRRFCGASATDPKQQAKERCERDDPWPALSVGIFRQYTELCTKSCSGRHY